MWKYAIGEANRGLKILILGYHVRFLMKQLLFFFKFKLLDKWVVWYFNILTEHNVSYLASCTSLSHHGDYKDQTSRYDQSSRYSFSLAIALTCPWPQMSQRINEIQLRCRKSFHLNANATYILLRLLNDWAPRFEWQRAHKKYRHKASVEVGRHRS